MLYQTGAPYTKVDLSQKKKHFKTAESIPNILCVRIKNNLVLDLDAKNLI